MVHLSISRSIPPGLSSGSGQKSRIIVRVIQITSGDTKQKALRLLSVPLCFYDEPDLHQVLDQDFAVVLVRSCNHRTIRISDRVAERVRDDAVARLETDLRLE